MFLPFFKVFRILRAKRWINLNLDNQCVNKIRFLIVDHFSKKLEHRNYVHGRWTHTKYYKIIKPIPSLQRSIEAKQVCLRG